MSVRAGIVGRQCPVSVVWCDVVREGDTHTPDHRGKGFGGEEQQQQQQLQETSVEETRRRAATHRSVRGWSGPVGSVDPFEREELCGAVLGQQPPE